MTRQAGEQARDHLGDIAFLFYYRRQNRYGLMAVAGALESVLPEVRLHFARQGDELAATLDRLAASGRKVVLGMSFFSTQVEDNAALLGKLRSKHGDDFIAVAGGPHPSGDPEGTLNLGFDIAVIGEGEAVAVDLARALRSGADLMTVKGIVFRRGREIVATGRRRRIRLGDYPPWAAAHRKFGPIEISRGCPYGCRFCQTTYMFGAKVRHRRLEDVLERVRQLQARKITDIRFLTPDAFAYGSADGRSVDTEALRALLSGARSVLGEEGRIFFGSFPSEVRPEHVTPAALDLVKKYAHNDNLVIGAQTGSPRLLRAARRGHGVDDVRRAVGLIRRWDYRAIVDFIFGLPGETREDAAASLALMEELIGAGAVIHAHTFMPLPGTPWAAAPPGCLSPHLRLEVRRLVAQGKLFGEWHRQERHAVKMKSPKPAEMHGQT